MKRSETQMVLVRIASMDNRRLDDPQADFTPILDAWHDVIGDLNVQDCLEGVRRHRMESTEYLTAAHVRAQVSKLRRARLEGVQDADLTEDVDPGEIQAYLATLRYRLAAIADGASVDQAKALPLPPAAAHARIGGRARPALMSGGGQ